MTTTERIIKKNIEISTEFGKFVLDNPKVAEKIPLEALLIFIDETDPELTQYNLSLSKRAEKEKRPIIKIRIKGLLPETTRLLEPQLEFAT